MRAAVHERYGPPEVVALRDVPTPTPQPGQILIRTVATTVTAGDWRVRSLDVPAGFGLVSRLAFGITGPRQRILGMEIAGEVAAVGSGVTRFAVGDQVFAYDGFRMGCHAEFKCIDQDGPVEPLPANLDHGEAAALSFGGTTALDFFRRGNLAHGERVLVVGASGGVGTAAVQIAKHQGAHVTGVCSTANVDLVRSLGADAVVDYTHQDALAGGEAWDVILDAAGTAPYRRSKAALRKGGRLLLVLGDLPGMLQAPGVSLLGRHRVVAGPASAKPADLRVLAALAVAGELRPVIDRRYPFEQIVDAHRYVDAGHKRGNVVVDVAPGA